MIVIPASLRSDFIHMPGMTIHIALESTIHIVGIRTCLKLSLRENFPANANTSPARGIGRLKTTNAHPNPGANTSGWFRFLASLPPRPMPYSIPLLPCESVFPSGGAKGYANRVGRPAL